MEEKSDDGQENVSNVTGSQLRFETFEIRVHSPIGKKWKGKDANMAKKDSRNDAAIEGECATDTRECDREVAQLSQISMRL